MTPERKNKLHGRPPLRRTSIETQYGFPPGFEAYLKRTFPNVHPGWFNGSCRQAFSLLFSPATEERFGTRRGKNA